MDLLEPKEIELTTLNGETRTYIISKFGAVAGREIVAKYPLTAVPKVGDYESNQEVMFKLMAYVAVKIGNEGKLIQLSTRALIDNHVPDWETLVKIEAKMLEYNTSFFGNGEISTFLKNITRKWWESISPTLIPSLELLLAQVKLRLKSLNTNTRLRKR